MQHLFDLEALKAFAKRRELEAWHQGENVVAIPIGRGMRLCFENDESGGSRAYIWNCDGTRFSERDMDLHVGGARATAPVRALKKLLDGSLLVERRRLTQYESRVALQATKALDLSSLEEDEEVTFYRISKSATYEATMSEYLDYARKLHDEGRHQEALERYVWFHDNALDHAPSMYGVRLSFALSDWENLGKVFHQPNKP